MLRIATCRRTPTTRKTSPVRGFSDVLQFHPCPGSHLTTHVVVLLQPFARLQFCVVFRVVVQRRVHFRTHACLHARMHNASSQRTVRREGPSPVRIVPLVHCSARLRS